ncbi:MAG TPA: tetratricopeptide repeat protein [Nitrospiraceae bacterium]|nr:tetratricopeptide repeat protein [Nitrospiraceae bacterium]
MPTQLVVTQGLIVGLLVGGAMLTGCAGSKDSTSPSFDMSEYQKVMERQKGEQASFEEPASSTPEMTAEEHERTGDMNAQRRNFPLASVHYSKGLKADPARNSVRLKLGQVFLQQGMFEPALTQFQDLRTREPNSAPAHQGIGHVYLLQGKLREAEEALTKAVALDPSNWLAYNLLGLAYDQEKRHTEAITSYKAALAIRPREPGVLNNLGLAYALSGDHEAAIQSYEQAVAAGSSSPKLYNNLGIAYAKRRRYTDALDSFKKATDEPRAYNNLGVALLNMGDPKRAAGCFEKAIELNPQFYERAADNLRRARQALENGKNRASASGSSDLVSCP